MESGDPMLLRSLLRALTALTASSLLMACAGCRATQPVVLTVSVAASLTDAIQAAEAVYTRAHPLVEFRNNFGGSGTLAQQIELGAPVDIFLSAAEGPMSELDTRGLLVSGSRRNLLRNTLVLIAPQDSKLSGFEQLTDPGVRTVAIGDPGHVPAGKYAQQTLTALHLLPALQPRLVLGENVRQVLAYVETGNADAGIVYATDAAITRKVRVVATAPESTHDPIIYPVAVLRAGAHPDESARFLAWLVSPAARSIFTQRGFTMAAQ